MTVAEKTVTSRVAVRRAAWAGRRVADLVAVRKMLEEEWSNANSVVLGDDDSASLAHEAITQIREAIETLERLRLGSPA